MRAPADSGPRIEIIEPGDEPGADERGPVIDVVWEPAAPGPSRLEPWFEHAEEIERRLDRTVFRLRRRRELARSGNARRDSRVRQHIWRPFTTVRSRLPATPTRLVAGTVRLDLRSGFEPTPKGAVRAPGVLRLRGSWPGLAVWVTVEPWWRNRTVATIALRNHRRWRYPRRYFAAAHAVAQALAEVVDPGGRGPYKSRTCDLLRVEQAL